MLGTLALAPWPGLPAPAGGVTAGGTRTTAGTTGNDRYYYGYHYRRAAGGLRTPYNYGYYAPPVVYDNTPGFSITIRP